jgi:hypothetical protein
MKNKKWEETDFNSLFPMVMKVASKTIGMDLVSVDPFGKVGFATDEIKAEVNAINRDSKIDNIIEGKEYKEMKPEEHPDYYKEMPRGELFYLDFKYDPDDTGLSQSRL